MRRDILDSYPALDPARVHVVHNGIDTGFYRPDPARDALAANGIDPDKPSRGRSSAGSPGRRASGT